MPVNCPGYKTGVKKLLKPKYRTKVMNANLKYKVLMYVDAKLAKRLGAAHHSVSSTLAQMCWQKRRAKAGQPVEPSSHRGSHREAFEGWYDCFYDHMDSHTKGWFGDYAMKCILDVGTNCTIKATKDNRQVFPDALLSKWPVNCPGSVSYTHLTLPTIYSV